MSVTSETGTISVHMENIFPIVKKALYNDKEIFLRELVSNAVDAINKYKHLAMIGEAAKDDAESKIEIRFNKEERQLIIKSAFWAKARASTLACKAIDSNLSLFIASCKTLI